MAKSTKSPIPATPHRLTPVSTVLIKAAPARTAAADVLLIGVSQGANDKLTLLPGTAGLVDVGLLAKLGASGALGEVTRVPGKGTAAPVIAVVGLGKITGAPEPEVLRKAAGAAARSLAGCGRVAVLLLGDKATPEQVRALTEGLVLGSYAFHEFRTEKSLKAKKKAVRSFTLLLPKDKALSDAAKAGVATARGVVLTRDLVNTPAGDLGPQDFADVVMTVAAEAGISVQVWDEKQLAAEGFGGLIGVGQGSHRPPRLIRLEWAPGAAEAQTVALVGKGIVFDSGGLSIKPASGMETMKYDMGGAATVVGTILTAAALHLPVRVVAWCALAENMPSGTATRPGDVLRIFGGTTVEVLNTDAEGRLVLADALVRATQEKPDLVVDVATLTGAAVVALGRCTFAIMGTETAREQVAQAARSAGESAWVLPLTAELRPALDSDVADLKNIGGTEGGGTITAGLFLKEFVPEGLQWAHLDIAGPGWNSNSPTHHLPKGSTGVPVRTLVTLLETVAADGV